MIYSCYVFAALKGCPAGVERQDKIGGVSGRSDLPLLVNRSAIMWDWVM